MSEQETPAASPLVPAADRFLPPVHVTSTDPSSKLMKFTALAFNRARRNTGVLSESGEPVRAKTRSMVKPRQPKTVRTTLSRASAVLESMSPARSLPERFAREAAVDDAMEQLNLPVVLVPRSKGVRQSQARRGQGHDVSAFRRLLKGE